MQLSRARRRRTPEGNQASEHCRVARTVIREACGSRRVCFQHGFPRPGAPFRADVSVFVFPLCPLPFLLARLSSAEWQREERQRYQRRPPPRSRMNLQTHSAPVSEGGTVTVRV